MYWNQEVETLSREKLQSLQLERLQKTARRVYEKVPFFRQLYNQAEITPDDLKSLDDLAKFPFVKKTNLRENYPFGLFAEPTENMVRLHASSGTKGKPTVVGYTYQDIANWSECMARSLMTGGARPGDVIHNAYGYGLFTGGLGIHYGAETMGACVVPISGGNTPRQVMLLQDFQARILTCTPSYALNIAEALEEMKVSLDQLNLEYGVFGAEPWTEEMRAQLEAKLGLKGALDIYGLSEVMGPGVAMECAEGRNGLHIWEDHFYPEIINPETGEPLPYGETGELVFSTLTKEGFALLRYRTGDLCTLYNDPCPCGRTHVRMGKIKGRTDDMLIIRGVNVFPSEIERVLLTFPELAPYYQIILERPGALDLVYVDIEVTPEYHASRFESDEAFQPDHHELYTLRQRISHELHSALGISVDLRINMPHKVPRSEGKAVRVVDKRPK
jgi:phenylacetate-CoA ligase